MRRNRPLGMLETFDLPKMEPNCEARTASTVAPQSLALMNSAFCLSQADLFAERVLREAGSDPGAQIRHAWQIALQTDPTAEQLKKASVFLKSQASTLEASPAMAKAADGKTAPVVPARAALATLCQALLNSNAFLYID
jgi:hypothetical protein